MTSAPTRSAWHERFERPTLDALVAQITNRDAAAVFEHARKLLTKAGLDQELDWHGLPWRWSLAFTHPEAPDRAVAYLVPDPAAPKLCVIIKQSFIAQLVLKRFQRPIREGIARGTLVGACRWCQWDLTVQPIADEAITIALSSFASP